MSLNDIIFIKGKGGLGRPLAGEDFISGLLLFSANLPSGYSTSNRIKQFFSVADAEAAGIKSDYSDGTAASGSYLVTAVGSNGDTLGIKVTEIGGNVVNFGTYTKVSGDTTVNAVATSIAALINAGTFTHGYTAVATTATVAITAPKKNGVFLNSGTPIVVTIVGTIAGTLTQFSGGVASKQAVWHYHISEYFRLQPQGSLYVGIYAVPSTYTFTEITTMQNFANGKIRQIGVFKDATFAVGDLTVINTEIVTNCDANHKPLSAIYAADLSATADLSTLTDLNTLSANKVSAVIGQDGAGLGSLLYASYGKSITCLGAVLGAASLSSVSEDIAWVGKFDMSNGYELDTLAFANGVLVASSSQNFLNALDNLRYIFLIKYVGIAGSYVNDSHTAIAVSSDYAYIENNRTIDKAIRGVYASVLPALNAPLKLNSDGTLADTTIAYYESLAELNLVQMIRDNELSAQSVSIDSTQNVLSTNTLVIAVKLVPIGVARAIQVNISFATQI
ncbi:Bacteriophage HP1, Orf23 [uncultured Caudovirales phage]|uniref:Bacteriophage HP1, Orf23 n=1 Tax=uncultured Caudovirales phage TaxID=2100421 RepID=A0A6J7W8Q3_9CAUD|nr:Bacteriophage HP1, Orf23 [uncultured Caudovirales phage]CAB5171007.1 Bacteriophage HP1, Orf23 [uncultured Caudovirales phage]